MQYVAEKQKYYVWLFARKLGSHGQQLVPSLGGFISCIGNSPRKKSTIDYYTPINEPITEYNTVAELLKRSEEATKEVGQKYVVTTYDLGVIMKVMPIIWKSPESYKDHIVLIGQFHTAMNYINMLLGHNMLGSGFQEILIESQLVTTGCLRGVLNGKAYAKSLFCIKTVCEAMERLLIDRFAEEENAELNPKALLELLDSCDQEHLNEALNEESTVIIIRNYQAYEEKVRQGELGKTAAFWMSFIDHARLLFLLLIAVKKNNFPLFHKCMNDMADLFFAYGGQNYARYIYLIIFDRA